MTQHKYYTCDCCGKTFENKTEALYHELECYGKSCKNKEEARQHGWNYWYNYMKEDMGRIFLVLRDHTTMDFTASANPSDILYFYIPSMKAYRFFLDYLREKEKYDLLSGNAPEDFVGWYHETDAGWKNIRQEISCLYDLIDDLNNLKRQVL